MRGQNALYNDIIPSPFPEASGEKIKRNNYMNERDEAMAHRYYYYAHLLRRNYTDCIFHLHQEFFLTTTVTIERLIAQNDCIKQLIKANLTPVELKKRYGYFNWSV